VGVGRAATTSFVHSFIVILLLDLMLNIGINWFYNFLWPDGPRLF
jgi:phospholipid/cholesterol/gamma-HCH transport system permease protein